MKKSIDKIRRVLFRRLRQIVFLRHFYYQQPEWIRAFVSTIVNRFFEPYHYVAPMQPDGWPAVLADLAKKPLFSVVVPLYKTSPACFERMVASVVSQWYPHWELILVDDGSDSETLRASLAAIKDERIHVLALKTNQGISAATNVGIAHARGDFVLFLDHDDELTVDCLYEMACCVARENPDVIYSDEDKITIKGRHVQPHFKPDWSPEALMSLMYICHVVCVRRTVLDQVGGLRSVFDGCQDWDLLLRLSEVTQRISHIPKILYHWRIVDTSTAAKMSVKPHTVALSKILREEALARRGLNGVLESLPMKGGHFRVKYTVQGTPLISIIIPTRDNEPCLRQCVESILQKTQYPAFEIIVIDNGSREQKTLAYLSHLGLDERITVVTHDIPFNFSELCQVGSRHAKGDLLLFLNDDTEVLMMDWLERLGGYAQLPHVGAVGAKLLYGDKKTVQHLGILNLETGPSHAYLKTAHTMQGYFYRNQLEYNWLAVTGACLMIERKKFDKIGGFDEAFPVAYNDVELCIRLHRAGFYQVVCQAVHLIHHESLSRGHDTTPEKALRLRQDLERLYDKHPEYRHWDPFFNVNFLPNNVYFEKRSVQH